MAEAEKEDVEKRDSAAPWLEMLQDADEADRYWHTVCDRADDAYSNLKKLAAEARPDREMQIFWANLEVLKPSIYSRPPAPVVAPRFKDRKDLPRKAADVMERALITDIDADHLHDTLLLARDDLAMIARGVVWITDDERDGVPVAMAEHLDRKDYRQEPARKHSEVGWKARQAFLSKPEVKDRFGAVPPTMKFEERKIGDFKGDKKAAIWEIWHKGKNTVVWVCEDCEYVLDQRPPHLKLTDFFPCPKPAYGTLQRGTMIPVPDRVYYVDQLEEINDATNRIAALTDALKMRGFYNAGNADIAAAIESAMRKLDDRALLEPVNVPSFAPGASLKDAIVWLPVVEIMQVIQGLIEIRRQLIDDVYQITGLSDIMRGATDPNETLGAQQLKSQYGSVRVRERQMEMARLARDVIRIKAEIMAENVPIDALLEMSQVDDIPTQADLAQQAQQIQAQAQQAIMGVIQQAMQATQQPQMPPEQMPPGGMAPQGAPMQ